MYGGGSYHISHFTALATVLKACLVNGYGDSPAAGWALINEGSNFIVLRSGNNSFYVGISYMGNGDIAFYLSETYTGMNGNIMAGDGLKSGVAAGSTNPQIGRARYLAQSSATSCWAVSADPKSFCIGMMGDNSDTVLTVSPGFDALVAYVGEDLQGLPIALGGTPSATSTKNSFFSAQAAVTVMKSPRTGLLAGASAMAVSTPSLHVSNVLSNPASACPFESVTLVSPTWFADSAYGGRIRGVAQVVELSYNYNLNFCARSLGRSTNLTIRGLSQPLDLGDGFSYLILPVSSGACVLLTDNPEFWP